jgi:Aldo/keto reductase family
MSLTNYRALGRSGLVVSPLCLGTMTFGPGDWGVDEAGSRAIFDRYRDAGGNFVDTADIYAGGISEEFVGKFIKDTKSRDEIVLATKFGFNESRSPLAGNQAGAGNPQPMRPPTGCRSIVITAGKGCDCLGQVAGECGAVSGRGEPDLGIDGQRGEVFVRLARAPPKITDLAHDTRTECHQIAGGQAILAARGVRCHATEDPWRYGIGSGACYHQALGQPTPRPRVGDLDQPVLFQHPQVIVDPLSLQAKPCSECRGRCRLLQFR